MSCGSSLRSAPSCFHVFACWLFLCLRQTDNKLYPLLFVSAISPWLAVMSAQTEWPRQVAPRKPRWTFRGICITSWFIPLGKLRALVWVDCTWSIYFLFHLDLWGKNVTARPVNLGTAEYLPSSIFTCTFLMRRKNNALCWYLLSI